MNPHFMTAGALMTRGTHAVKFRFDALSHYTLLGISRVGNYNGGCGIALGWGGFGNCIDAENAKYGCGLVLAHSDSNGKVWWGSRFHPPTRFAGVKVGDEIELRLDLDERDVFECRVNGSEWKTLANGCFKANAKDGYWFACSVNRVRSETSVTIVL